MTTLKGRTCVFSGGSGRVGRGAVKAMCEAGMNVVLSTHMIRDAREIVESLKDCEGKCIAISAECVLDVVSENGENKVVELPALDKDSGASNLEYAKNRFGSVDVVISNTGAFDSPVPVEDITPDDLSKKLTHQIIGSFTSVLNALPYLKESKAPRIILNASAGAQDGLESEYLCDSVARGGVISLTYCLAKELAKYGITVNCIAKSGIINDHEPHGRVLDTATLIPQIPVGRLGTADEYGAAVQYLVSEEAAFITGQVINLSGGLHIG